MSLGIPVSVSYASDPEKVERLLLDVARAAIPEVPELLAEPAPSVQLIPGFGDGALKFTLNCNVTEFVAQYAVQHELRKRILKRFHAERIEIGFPAQTVYVRAAEKEQ